MSEAHAHEVGQPAARTAPEIGPALLHSVLSRPLFAKLALAAFFLAQVFGFVAHARARESSESPAAPPESHGEVRRALREFDRFLDHHPLLENKLRRRPQLMADQTFLTRNPALHDFLRANPSTTAGLNLYPRYYLNRGLQRQASAPLSFKELAPFKELFQQQPKLQQELTEDPELIRNPAYLASHAPLQTFLTQHPQLAQVFLPSTVPAERK